MKKCSRRAAGLVLGALAWGLPFTGLGHAADLSLSEAIELALAQNTALRVTQKGEESAEAALRKAKGNNGVSVSASDNLSFNKREHMEYTSANTLSLNGKLPLYTGGANQANIRSAKLGVDTAQLATERGREDLKLSVIKAYYDALQARKTIDVDQESVDNYQAHLTNVQQLYSAGSKARIDVLRSSVQLSDAQQTLIKAQNAYEVDLATLRNLLNMDRNEPLNLTTDFSYEQFAAALDEAIAYAYANRKDLLADAYQVEQKEQAVKAARAGYLPSVNLNVGADQDNDLHPTSDSTHGMSAGLGISWNIFDSGVTHATVDSAETDLDVAKLNLKRDRETADLELRQAYYSMREAEKRFKSTSDAVQQAEEDYYIAREKYRAGEGLMLDIIDAQLALSTARLNHISAQYDYARYKAEVENKMGLGITETERTAALRLLDSMEAAVAEAGALSEQTRREAGANVRAEREAAQAGQGGKPAARTEARAGAESAAQVAEELAK